jgi:hypothetical protein
MVSARKAMLWVNIVGGVAVLGSYALGLAGGQASGAALWGGVSGALRSLYGVSMLLAALGYFAFTNFLLLRLKPEETTLAGKPRFAVFTALYVGILAPSALWMPLTLSMLNNPGATTWWVIRLVLALVALSSGGLLLALLALQRKRGAAYWLAVVGAVIFFLHTAILDAVLWPAFFPR